MNSYVIFVSLGFVVCWFCYLILLDMIKHYVDNKNQYKKEEKKDCFYIKFNPQKDITSYELAVILSTVNPLILHGSYIAVDRNNIYDMNCWNSIPILIKRHFIECEKDNNVN